MSKLSQISGSRNWLFGRLAGIKNNLAATIAGGRQRKSLTMEEVEDLKQAFILIQKVTKNQKDSFVKLKKDINGEDDTSGV